VRTGILAARAPIIVTLDGDGQNDPADAPRLAKTLRAGPETLALVGGERVKRQDSNAKRLASKFGNGVRKRLLKDTANDTGCGLKAFRREAFLRLPYFDHIHRYIPALMLREGYEVAFQPVNHRHRETGVSKYTNFGRLKASVSDLLGVMWLQSRARNPQGVDEA
jgi:glycosyltransferase involved in cell wall biosynthesis